MAYRVKTLFKILTMGVFIISCDPRTEKTDVSDIKINTPVARFEKDLFEVENETDLKKLKEKYPVFSELFFRNIIGVGNTDEATMIHYLRDFQQDTYIREVMEKCQEVYPDLNETEKEFNKAFKYYHHHFPGAIIPRLISFMSGFSYTIIVDDSLLAFSLDMYLGSDCEFYPRLGIPQYKFLQMDRDHIVSDGMKAWISTEYEPETKNNDLLEVMVYNGKLLYALDLLLPGTPDHIKANYTEEQIRWCRENEAEIWFHFIDRELLYEQDNNVFIKYMSEGPFTPGFPEGSPGQIGKWVGWQIVRKYMETNSSVTLKQLFEEQVSASDILNQSNYKPKK